jgi:hypothetical protein
MFKQSDNGSKLRRDYLSFVLFIPIAYRKAMEALEPNGPTATKEPDKENTEPEEIYLDADRTEEVAVGQNGKRFKVKYKPSTQVSVPQRNLYKSHMFQLINR